MRISRDPNDPGYTENFLRHTVILDGIVQVRVQSADEEKGEITLTNGEVRKGRVRIAKMEHPKS